LLSILSLKSSTLFDGVEWIRIVKRNDHHPQTAEISGFRASHRPFITQPFTVNPSMCSIFKISNKKLKEFYRNHIAPLRFYH
jgi:hypothetical protein